jgi:hypothetical protein
MNNDIDNPNSEYWKQKYLKYKSKYMNLNNTTGGRHSHRSNSPYKNRSNSPYKNYSNNYYNNPYYGQQYPTLPQMPFIVTNSDSNLTIGNDNSDVSIVMPLSPLGPFGPVARGNTMLGSRAQFFTVLSPKSKKPVTTTTPSTTTTTSFTDDPIYKAHGSTIKVNSTIYFKIKRGVQYLVNNDDSVITKSLNNSSPYSNQIKEYLDEFLDNKTSFSDIKNKDNFMVVNARFVFKITTTKDKKGDFKFADATGITGKEKIEL